MTILPKIGPKAENFYDSPSIEEVNKYPLREVAQNKNVRNKPFLISFTMGRFSVRLNVSEQNKTF